MNIEKIQENIATIEKEIIDFERSKNTGIVCAITMLKDGNLEAAKKSVDKAYQLDVDIRMNEDKLAMCKELQELAQ